MFLIAKLALPYLKRWLKLDQIGSGHTEYDGLVKTISAAEDPAQRAILLERFRDQTDSLSLAIVTGNFLLGLDNPLISTIYVLSSVSLQLSHTLAGLLSRPYPGKESGLIVDYMGLNWGLKSFYKAAQQRHAPDACIRPRTRLSAVGVQLLSRGTLGSHPRR